MTYDNNECLCSYVGLRANYKCRLHRAFIDEGYSSSPIELGGNVVGRVFVSSKEAAWLRHMGMYKPYFGILPWAEVPVYVQEVLGIRCLTFDYDLVARKSYSSSLSKIAMRVENRPWRSTKSSASNLYIPTLVLEWED